MRARSFAELLADGLATQGGTRPVQPEPTSLGAMMEARCVECGGTRWAVDQVARQGLCLLCGAVVRTAFVEGASFVVEGDA